MTVLRTFAAGIPLGVFRAWVIQHLWAWFAVPTFHVATPQVAVIYGLMVLVGMLWRNPMPEKNPPLVDEILFSFFASLLSLVLGAVAHGFAG